MEGQTDKRYYRAVSVFKKDEEINKETFVYIYSLTDLQLDQVN